MPLAWGWNLAVPFYRERTLIQDFINNYGYYAVFLFACIEGEVALLTAGVLCHHGMMTLPAVILTAFVGTLITEQSLFFVGHFYGDNLLKKFPKIAQKSGRILDFLRKYDSAFIFGSRFVYGIRNFSPIVIGIAKIPPIKFIALNIPAAAVWAIVVACTGYACSNFVELAKEHMQYVEIGALVAVTIGLGYYLYRRKKSDK